MHVFQESVCDTTKKRSTVLLLKAIPHLQSGSHPKGYPMTTMSDNQNLRSSSQFSATLEEADRDVPLGSSHSTPAPGDHQGAKDGSHPRGGSHCRLGIWKLLGGCHPTPLFFVEERLDGKVLSE